MSGALSQACHLRGKLGLDWIAAILLGLAFYLLGSVPTGYIVVYLAKGLDIRQGGTGNVGALNAYQQTGAAGGMLVLAVDAGKGVLAILAGYWLGLPYWAVFLTGHLIVAGHNWPILLGFRGGKGAAAIFGISLAAQPAFTLVTLAAVLLILVLVRNVVWSAAFGFVLLNTLLLTTQQGADEIGLCVALTLVVTSTYVFSIRDHIGESIKARQWRELITGLA